MDRAPRFAFAIDGERDTAIIDRFLAPITLIAPISAVREFSAKPETLVFYRRHPVNDTWSLPTQTNYVDNVLQTTIEEPGDFALGPALVTAGDTGWEFDPGSPHQGRNFPFQRLHQL